MTNVKQIKISELVKDLKSGVTRWKKDDLGFGSIEEKYDLDFKDMKQITSHPKLKGIRTVIPTLILIDDLDDDTFITANSSQFSLEENIHEESNSNNNNISNLPLTEEKPAIHNTKMMQGEIFTTEAETIVSKDFNTNIPQSLEVFI